jgi:hypothetical protein
MPTSLPYQLPANATQADVDLLRLLMETTGGSSATPDFLRNLSGSNYNLKRDPATIAAYSQLLDILRSQGSTNPAALAAINKTTANTFGAAPASVPGADAATLAAINQAGQVQGQRNTLIESQLADQRKRSDLGLFKDMVINPALANKAVGLQVNKYSVGANADRLAQNQQIWQNIGALFNKTADVRKSYTSSHPTS